MIFKSQQNLNGGNLNVGNSGSSVNVNSNGYFQVIGNNVTNWDDLMFPGHSARSNASAPNLGNGIGGNANIYVYEFNGASTLEQVYFQVQLPHSWKEGTTLYPHVHFYPIDTNGGDTNNRVVRFTLEYTWANVNSAFGASSLIHLDSDPFVPNTSLYKHMICKNSTGIDATGKKISSMMACHLYRDPTDVVDTFSSKVGFLQFDIHHHKDAIGSNQEFIK